MLVFLHTITILYWFCYRRQKEVWNFKITNDGESFGLYENDGFASVPDLIEYYQQNPSKFLDQNNKSVQLTEPLIQDEGENDPGLTQEK